MSCTFENRSGEVLSTAGTVTVAQDRAPQSLQRALQAVRRGGDGSPQFGFLMGGQGRRGGPTFRLGWAVFQRLDRPLGDAQLVLGPGPQEQVDPLQNVLGLMLDQQGRGPDDA